MGLRSVWKTGSQKWHAAMCQASVAAHKNNLLVVRQADVGHGQGGLGLHSLGARELHLLDNCMDRFGAWGEGQGVGQAGRRTGRQARE